MDYKDIHAVSEINIHAWRSAYKDIISQQYLDELDIKKSEVNWAEGFTKHNDLIRLVCLSEEGIVCGYLCGGRARDKNGKIDGELYAIYVSPNKKRNGCGELLFKEFKKELIRLEFKNMNVWVLEANYSGRKFYEKMGGLQSSHTKYFSIGEQKLLEISYVYNF